MTIYTDPLKRPIAGNLYVPDSMEARGSIKPIPPITGQRNGMGEQIRTGIWGYEWRFKVMNKTEFQWWADLVDFGEAVDFGPFSKRFTEIGSGGSYMPACRLWVNNTFILNFREAVVDLPTWQEYKNGLYHDCLVKFAFMTV